MNMNFILLASLALFSAGAASANTESQIPVLPTHVVTVSRYTDAERAIQASLAEFRQAAKIAPAITAQPALPQREVAQAAPQKLAPVAASSAVSYVAVKA